MRADLKARVTEWYLAVEALGTTEDALDRWRKARRALGTRQQFAETLGISVPALDKLLDVIRDEHVG
jgi:hypothetical protein